MKAFSVLVLLFAVFALPLSAVSSGSYSGRPPIPNVSVDTDKYHLGKKLFAGKVALGEASAALLDQQKPRLQELQKKLPENVQESVTLPAMAGKLNAQQMEALDYYISVRYKIK